MVKPFQFSMRRMFAAMSMCCLGVGDFFWLWKKANFSFVGSLPLWAALSAGAIIGGGLGMLVRMSLPCAFAGAALAATLMAAVPALYWFFYARP